MLKQTKILLWRLIAVFALLVGLVGVLLPVMPTVPFILLAAWAGGHGWPELEQYLLSHAHFGQPIRDWRERGAISRRAKWLATVMMSGSLLMIWLTPLLVWVKLGLTVTISCVLIWMWSRPEAR
jgi:uncharacterized membrane protein YbaN (DUF454 family)